MPSDEQVSSSVIAGTGEFQRGDTHVVSAVEIQGGVVRSVAFALASGGEPRDAEELTSLLEGRSVNEALAVHADPDSFVSDESSLRTWEVLLEAFHRAVETCLYQQ